MSNKAEKPEPEKNKTEDGRINGSRTVDDPDQTGGF